MAIYGNEQQALQQRFDTTNLAAAFEATIFNDVIDDDARTFIESRDFFFLSSVDADGWPTVSYKGGPVGMVRVVDERTVEFPSYDGNGMFLSMGAHHPPGRRVTHCPGFTGFVPRRSSK